MCNLTIVGILVFFVICCSALRRVGATNTNPADSRIAFVVLVVLGYQIVQRDAFVIISMSRRLLGYSMIAVIKRFLLLPDRSIYMSPTKNTSSEFRRKKNAMRSPRMLLRLLLWGVFIIGDLWKFSHLLPNTPKLISYSSITGANVIEFPPEWFHLKLSESVLLLVWIFHNFIR